MIVNGGFDRGRQVAPVGDIPPIVALHGFPENPSAWTETAAWLRSFGHRVIVPVQRGYDTSFAPRGRWNYRLPLLSADVLDLLDQLHIARAHIVGHDLGAMVAWDLATYHPERVAAVVAISAPHPGGFVLDVLSSVEHAIKAWYFGFIQLPFVPELCFDPKTPKSRSRLIEVLSRSGLRTDRASAYASFLKKDGLFTGAVNWYRAMPLVPVWRVLKRVDVPSTIVWGTKDRFTSRRSVDLSKRFVRGRCDVVVVDGGSHWLLDDAPDEIARLIDTALTRVD